MRELAILTFATLDGVMQAPRLPDHEGAKGFTRGGWAEPFWAETMDQVTREAMSKPYDALLGRKTYDLFYPHHSQNPTTPLDQATKYVVTSAETPLSWKNSIAIRGDVPRQIQELKNQTGPLLQVHGSGQLIQTLLAHDLVDEFRIWTFPILLGEGRRLFAAKNPRRDLVLKKSAPAGLSGVVMNIYRRRT